MLHEEPTACLATELYCTLNVLCVDLEVNGKELEAGRDYTEECCVGTPVNVKLTLTNNTSQ